MKHWLAVGCSLLAAVAANAQPAPPALDEFAPEMRDAAAAAALPPLAPDARLAPAPADAAGVLPPGWSEAPPPAATPAVQAWQRGWQQPSPIQVVHTRSIVPVPVPVAYGGWNRGWHRGWNRGYGGWNRGFGGSWGGGWNRGYYGRCRSSGGGALVGGIAGATIGYGLANPWDRSTGVIIGGLVGALAGSAIERSGRC